MGQKFVTLILFVVLFSSCLTHDAAEKRLTQPRSTRDFRIEKISQVLDKDPINAIHLCGIYEIVYSGDAAQTEEEKIAAASVQELKSKAIEKLKENQVKAAAEKRWNDAASLERSLAALGVEVKDDAKEGAYLLQSAKEYLSENKNLAAFLTAARSNEATRLSGSDAALFLERAVKVKMRRTAAFFLTIAEQGGSVINPEFRSFAYGRDGAEEMIKGVGTVIVDNGMKIEKGRGVKKTLLGSAFFIDDSGLMITNYHVISSEVDPEYEGYSKMSVRMGDSTSLPVPAKVIGWDKAMDLALIKAEIKPEYVFSVVDSIPKGKIGDSVLAIGSPVGLEKTVTMGIVSATGRRFLQIGDVIQIDAAVNHGNSGGPVVDTSGKLLGVVFAGADQFQGLNFAIPSGRLVDSLPALLKGGKAVRPWLGLSLAETREGAEIIYVAPLSPCADQRVKEGLRIKSIDGKQIKAAQGMLIPALQDTLFSRNSGELVALETSDGVRRVLRLQARSAVPLAEAAKIDTRERLVAPLFGIVLETSHGRSSTGEYLVKKVLRGSVADSAGLSPQDPVSIQALRIEAKDGYSALDINVKRKTSGFFETSMRILAALDLPDTL
ncbi:MAG: S1C family serine protease [Termitinemataceae bacterium]|nr:MAG: S1C family serine protease [Termitinemataceae bacterium]